MRLIPIVFLVFLLTGCPPRQHLAVQSTPTVVPQARVTQLVVRGEATIRVKPDQVEMSLEAVTLAASADEALATNSEAMTQLQQLLLTEGLGAADLRTGQFSIQPEWSRPPRPAPASWAPEIVGYRVSNRLQVSTTKIDRAGRLLALAQQAGVNKAGNLNFSLADPEAASLKAIAAATLNARRRAEVLAQSAGVKLGELLEARVEENGQVAPPMLMMAEAGPARAAASNVPISVGEIEVKAGVVLSYALAD